MKMLNWLLLRFYQLLCELVYFCAYPLLWLFLKGKHYTEALSASSQTADILIHAASLGEINALSALIKRLLAGGHSVAINTITVTGKKRAQELFPQLQVRLAPFDILHLKQQQLKQLKPKLILIAETEIWPNMLYAAQKAEIPILFINARISEKSLKAYLSIKGLLSIVSNSVKGIMAQSQADAGRFARIFDLPIKNLGNLKYALELSIIESEKQRAFLGYAKNDFILVWGSSRPKEEALLLKVLPELQRKIPELKLIIAPRHPKRISEVQELLKDLSYQLYSQRAVGAAPDILLIDVLGRLNAIYAISDLSIVGGSFGDFGGHNPLEPAFYQKAIIMGGDYSSCKDSVRSLLQREAILISNSDKLAGDIIKLYLNPALRQKMGENAKKVLTENAAALSLHLMEIEKCI